MGKQCDTAAYQRFTQPRLFYQTIDAELHYGSFLVTAPFSGATSRTKVSG
jgi:hypothetical protein